jgi:hypothetical protein
MILIALDCVPTPYTQKLEVLVKRRLNPTHVRRQDIEAEYRIRLKGYLGEKSLKFYLDMLPDKKFYIFFGIRLKYKNYYFQIDVLIICSSFVLALEAKKMDGDMVFERDFKQTTLHKNGRIQRINNPILQVMLQAKKLRAWIADHGFPDLPILYLFVNTNEKTAIKTLTSNQQVTQHVCNSEALLDKIEHYSEYYTNPKLEEHDLRKLKKLLLEKHTPEDGDVLKDFNLTKKDIIPGVLSPTNSSNLMKYKHGIWICPDSGAKFKTAHIEAVHDYFLLVKPTITNAELRWFLQIDSPKIAHRLLTSMNLPFTGKYRDRVYYKCEPQQTARSIT